MNINANKPSTNTSQSFKRFLKTLKKFDFNRNKKTVFNTSLKESVKVSSHQISLKAFPSYNVRIPTIIYVCTDYLRAHGTESKGVFRVSGSLKRMQNLQLLFEDTPKYGSNLDLKALGFTPFDVASTLTRYLTSLVEPVIPNELFHSFRSVLEQESVDTYKVEEYKKLLQSLEPDNLNLLLYLLDFFMEFNQYADATLMPYSNLASIFQPSILCLPEHVHLPEEYKKSQKVVEFLCWNYCLVAKNQVLIIPTSTERVELKRSLTNLSNKSKFLIRNSSVLSDSSDVSTDVLEEKKESAFNQATVRRSNTFQVKSRRRFTFF